MIQRPLGHVRLVARTGRARMMATSKSITPLPLATGLINKQSSLKRQPLPSGLRGGVIAIHPVLSTSSLVSRLRQRMSDGGNGSVVRGKASLSRVGRLAHGEASRLRLVPFTAHQLVLTHLHPSCRSTPPPPSKSGTKAHMARSTGSQLSPQAVYPSMYMVGSGRERPTRFNLSWTVPRALFFLGTAAWLALFRVQQA